MAFCAGDSLPELAALCEQEGLTLLGIADASYSEDAFRRYMQWVEAGRHGDMIWLERHARAKYAAEHIVPGCQSILVFGMSYYQETSPEPNAGMVSLYAWGRDYHKVLGNRLRRVAARLSKCYPLDQFKGYTDAVPLDERHYAVASGAGFLGRNTLLITRTMGSWLVLGEVLSTRKWAATNSSTDDRCPPACRRCLDACPTRALIGSGEMDASRCIAYLTIESKGPIPQDLRGEIGNRIFGCDICQAVCPLQSWKQMTDERDFLSWRAGPSLLPVDLLVMDAASFASRFAGTPIMRSGLWRMQRNACIVAGNLRDQSSLPALRCLQNGNDAVLREHATWALEKIQNGQ